MLDFDPFDADDVGRAFARRLLDQSATVITPTRGAHFWYRLPAGVTLGNSRGSLPVGFDVRACNGYVLLPGSTVTYSGEAARKKGVPCGFVGSYRVRRAGPIVTLPDDLLTLIQTPRRKAGNEAHTVSAAPSDLPLVRHSPALSDDEVLAVCRRLPSGARFDSLWAGHAGRYRSTSEAAKALTNLLTFVTQDPAQVDRLFQRSGLHPLYKGKWLRLAAHEIAESIGTARSFWRAGGAS